MTTWIVVAVIVAALWYYLFRFGKISRADAHKYVEQGAKLIDVRTPEEFTGGHLPGAINVPVSLLGATVDKTGSKEDTYVVYCASGARSAAATRMLKAAGRSKVYDLGAIGRW
jgi:phage shock protein E